MDEFSGFAGLYDSARPRMPAYPVQAILRYLGKTPACVVDLGCGTGLSALAWRGYCECVIGVEPNGDMLEQARKKEGAGIWFLAGRGEETGLAAASADAVVCSQSFHWMEPGAALAEVNRLLRSGGVFATVDYDWPPVCLWEAELAQRQLTDWVRAVERDHPELSRDAVRRDKGEHLERIRSSGYFRYCRELCFASREPCGAERLIRMTLSRSGVQRIARWAPSLAREQIRGFAQAVREAFRGREIPADFCYRMRIAVK